MALAQVLIDAVTYAVAGAAVEPALEPVRDLASRGIGAASRFASRVAASHAGALVPAGPLQTGRSLWDRITAPARALRDAWQENVFDPVNAEAKRFEQRSRAELQRFEQRTLRPAGQWITENPCESTKMALYFALGLGDPVTALAPCPSAQQVAQQDRATNIRYALLGGAALLAVVLLKKFKNRKRVA